MFLYCLKVLPNYIEHCFVIKDKVIYYEENEDLEMSAFVYVNISFHIFHVL